MLEIKPSLDELLLKDYCKKIGRIPGPAHYLYLATNRGEVLAAALFEVESDRVSVLHYESREDDCHLFDAVLRAGLNYAGEQGIPNGRLPEAFRATHKPHFDHLNYPAQAVFNITNFFKKYKNCAM